MGRGISSVQLLMAFWMDNCGQLNMVEATVLCYDRQNSLVVFM